MRKNGSGRGSVAIIGGGPAGLTAAYSLSKHGIPATVLEADPTYVGGISRTAQYRGYLFDIGGHRFFSKSERVESLWTEILGGDLIERPRSSRIFYRGRFFSYPLKATEALRKLGFAEASGCVLSYLKARRRPIAQPKSFEDWVVNQFGRRLYEIFFKTYTEKVWGMPCKEISADWASQRIQGLSLRSAAWNAVRDELHLRRKGAEIKTLITSFRYPRKGPGMMWDACARAVATLGGAVKRDQRVVSCSWDGSAGEWTVTAVSSAGETERVHASHVISSAPLSEIVPAITPEAGPRAIQAARALSYRDFLTVALIVEDRGALADNWIYVHDPAVKVGRVQNYKSWSPEMVPDPRFRCYGMEYFCSEGDELWTASDAALIELAKGELQHIGIARASDAVDGCVVRQKKAYPVYDAHYAARVGAIREELEQRYPTFHVVGRNGMHKYNNQDHAMMTALLTVENIVAGSRKHDVWRVNQDAEYHEAGVGGGEE